MNDSQQQLRKELLVAGASKAELKELLPIASELSLLKPSETTMTKTNHWRRVVKSLAFASSGLALGMLFVVLSQAASPTSFLYPAQKLSDNIVISLRPQYRATIMMKRAQQVNQLVASHADAKQVLATLADYTKEASVYKATPNSNYAAFEYCKINLQQAASTAPPAVRKAITNSLQALEST